MFCIGKLTAFTGKKGRNCSGCILQIYPIARGPIFFFRYDVYQKGTLLKYPEKVKGIPYVAYNLNQAGKPRLVTLLENVRHDSLYRLIMDNKFDGEEIDQILEKYCPEEIKNAKTKKVRVKKVETKAEGQKPRHKISVNNEIMSIIKRGEAFDPKIWQTYEDSLKAKIICQAACIHDNLWQQLIPSDNLTQLLDYEKKSSHQIIYALLLFLVSVTEQKTDAKKGLWREAHENLLTTIALAYRNRQSEEIISTIKAFLPLCTMNHNNLCDAILMEQYGDRKKYITCTQRRMGSIPCMESNIDKSIREHCTMPHIIGVDFDDAIPDLRDLLYRACFNLNDIPKTPLDDYLDSYAYPYRISSFVLRLEEVWEYLSCKKCANPLFPDFDYQEKSDIYTLTKFTCKNYAGNKYEHDYQIYLNHCYKCGSEKRGKKIIDSRECVRVTDPENNRGMWICMRCGGAKGYQSHRYCPVCGKEDITILNNDYIKCNSCGLIGSVYGQHPVSVEEILRFDQYRVNNKFNAPN